MFKSRFFSARYWTARYWGKGAAEEIEGIILSQARSDTLLDGRNMGTTASTGRNTSTTEDG